METAEQIKEVVRQKYGAIAELPDANGCCGSAQPGPTSCCGSAQAGPSSPGPEIEGNVPIMMAQDYQELNGYVADADLGLGCGLPTQFARIRPGDVVVDLGSGAGNDCFVARAETGETGRVIGLDMTPPMIDRARKNAKALGFTNVEFVYGDIEDMPFPENLADVVVSNCVMNLVPDKHKAFTETFRILKPGGHFSISDIVLKGELPEGLQKDAEMYVGCVSGAIRKDAYLQLIQDTGFFNIQVQKEREITLPDEVLQNYLSADEVADFRQQDKGGSAWGIYSVTVFAQKPMPDTETKTAVCCGPDCCN
ncbi:arsenite methyltransferase [Spirosoma utsteinense]|uniref:Arsenite methyltransferase n=1 Tax=Spirosoma utsteinense TaxID=2585773 RepID=A0ABR6WEM6_9BACT|nr:arsenite methyltransferase [Spirosoma utsteinense]MBC3788445.1 ubiquinone/menaquinone biosynthesis C-methylase UbiE [Spirosoma utsteinense]MBC3795003.1 ubiquinone/menaquinone biosynthesis C-methylase UbiE [Spirosoma utsteinense]